MKKLLLLPIIVLFTTLSYGQISHCYQDTGSVTFYDIVSQIEAHNDTAHINTAKVLTTSSLSAGNGNGIGYKG